MRHASGDPGVHRLSEIGKPRIVKPRRATEWVHDAPAEIEQRVAVVREPCVASDVGHRRTSRAVVGLTSSDVPMCSR